MQFLERDIIKNIDKKLLNEALTHSSYANEHSNTNHYERLEFLGDAVLELISSEYFYLNTDYREGEMTKKRASYVCEEALAHYAKDLGIDKCIRVGHGQLGNINDTIIADVFEAVLGAIYLTYGLDIAKSYVNDIMIPYIEKGFIFLGDYKSILQELVQTDKKSLEYIITNEYGKSNDKTFEVAVKIDGIIYGKGIGKSKKEAEQKAAFDAYKKSAR